MARSWRNFFRRGTDEDNTQGQAVASEPEPSTETGNGHHSVDLETADQQVLPRQTRPQAEPIEGLAYDWSQVVTEDGRQLQTVGHHFRLDRPLNNQERANIDRRGVCLACHQEIPDRSLAVSLLHHVAEYAGQLPKNRDEHTSLLHKILLFSAWGQVALGLGLPAALLVGGAWYVRRRRRRPRQTD